MHTDHLGTPRAITRPSDNVFMWRRDNTEAFGNSQPNENPAGQGTFKYAMRFPGQYYDAEIVTSYNYFRDYDPSIGRYVESDPIGLDGGLNTFAYDEANPLALVDPYGLANGPATGWMRPRPPCTCPYPPLPPVNVDVNKNMCEARDHANPWWFYKQVRNKGPWDYKQRGPGYQEFGNFNYGATGVSHGFSDNFLLRMAGWAQQQAGTSRPGWGHPLGDAPYGDDPDDQKWIQWGIQYARCGCKP